MLHISTYNSVCFTYCTEVVLVLIRDTLVHRPRPCDRGHGISHGGAAQPLGGI